FFAIFFFRAGCAGAGSFARSALVIGDGTGGAGLTADPIGTLGVAGRGTTVRGEDCGETATAGFWASADLRSAARTSGGADLTVSVSEGARSTDRPAIAPPTRSTAAVR